MMDFSVDKSVGKKCAKIFMQYDKTFLYIIFENKEEEWEREGGQEGRGEA